VINANYAGEVAINDALRGAERGAEPRHY